MLATLNLRTILANPLSGNSAELQHAKRMLDMCLLRDLNPLLFFLGQCEIESRFSGALTGDTVGATEPEGYDRRDRPSQVSRAVHVCFRARDTSHSINLNVRN